MFPFYPSSCPSKLQYLRNLQNPDIENVFINLFKKLPLLSAISRGLSPFIFFAFKSDPC